MPNKPGNFTEKITFLGIAIIIGFIVFTVILHRSDSGLIRRATFNTCLDKVSNSSTEISKETIQACEDVSFRLVPPKM